MAAYQNAISQVKLYGPTNASPIINHVAKFAEQAAQDTKASVNVFSFDSFDAILVDIRNMWHPLSIYSLFLILPSSIHLKNIIHNALKPVNSKRTGTLTQYNNPYNRMKRG